MGSSALGNETNRLSEAVAIVTGAGRGIGRAVALRLASEGATVYAVARTRSDLIACAQEAQGLPASIIPVPGDVTQPSFVVNLFRQVKEERAKLDILVNSAGCAPFGSIFEMDPADFRACLELNVWAAFLCTQQAVRLMRARNRGKVINVGSVRSHWSEAGGAGAYNASKYGLRGFTESVARELHGQDLDIAIGLVCPGVVNTTLTNPQDEPKPGWLRVEDVAEAVLHAVCAPDRINVYDTVLFPTSQRPW
jgi:NAD(P)-dependent dehydrogenase (short-subunit alcohol dehydrogenase family)